MYTPVRTGMYQYIPVHTSTSTYFSIPVHTSMYWYVLFYGTYMYIPICTGMYLSVPVHTSTSMYLYIPVLTGMYWYVPVHTGVSWYVLVHNSMYWYVLVYRQSPPHSLVSGWQLNPYNPTQVQQAQGFRISHALCRLGSFGSQAWLQRVRGQHLAVELWQWKTTPGWSDCEGDSHAEENCENGPSQAFCRNSEAQQGGWSVIK